MEGYLAGGGLTGTQLGVDDLPVRGPGGVGGGILVDAVPATGIAIPKAGGGGFGYPLGVDGGLFTVVDATEAGLGDWIPNKSDLSVINGLCI